MGLKALRKIQIGEEGAKGTAVAATAILLGALTMKDAPTIHRPDEERGSMAEFFRSIKVANLAELSFEGDATFEQILYLLHMGVLGNVTPSGDGSETPYLWTFTPAMAAAGVYDAFTLEYGDDIQAWETEFCMASEISIKGALNEAMSMGAAIFGRKLTAASFTSALSLPTVESIPFQKAKLYIDDEDGTIGSTEKSSLLVAAEYVISTGLTYKRYADGSIDFSNYQEGVKNVELKMTFAFNAAAEVERLLFDGSTLRLFRVEAKGSDMGGTLGNKKLTLDLCGIYTDFSTLEDREGEDVVSVTISGQLSTNYTKLFEVAVTNDVATLP